MPSSHLPTKILIVVDPTQEEPIALQRAIVTTQMVAQNNTGSAPSRHMHILVAADLDANDSSADNPNMRRDRDWFNNKLMEPLEASGVEYSLEISWSDDWYGSILKAAEAYEPELIMLPMMQKPRSSGLLFNDSVWRLLRTAACPVLIAQKGGKYERANVLAAVNFQSHKAEYQELNELIIQRGQWISRTYGADMHVVNAYSDSLNYPDRAKLAEQTEVDTANIHVQMGDPDEAIAAVATDIEADIVVLGTRSRFSRWRGNTAEKIINKVDCDILAINK